MHYMLHLDTCYAMSSSKAIGYLPLILRNLVRDEMHTHIMLRSIYVLLVWSGPDHTETEPKWYLLRKMEVSTKTHTLI